MAAGAENMESAALVTNQDDEPVSITAIIRNPPDVST